MISVEKVSKSYGDFKAISNISFEIGAGEIVGLLGHNGAGKTTIMKILSGVFEPDTGNAKIGGLDISQNRQECQKLVGYLPESVPLYDDMLVGQYLEFLYKAQTTKEDFQSRLKYVLEATDIKDKVSSQISTLSKGYRQRVGLAQALIHNPKVLILDEPTNGLDPSQIKDMRSLIVDLSKDTTIILSTHIMQEVTAICDRVILIKAGKIELDKPLSEISSEGKLKFRINLEQNFPPQEALEEIRKLVIPACDVDSVEILDYCPDSSSYDFIAQVGSAEGMDSVAAALNGVLVSKGFHVSSLTTDTRSLESIFTS